MGRRSEVESTNSNPAEKFLEWSSQNKCLKYYDKEAEENKLIKLPFTFLYLAERTTVRGFDDKDQTGIYSNEVKYLTEELEVKNFKGKEIAKGIWKDISAEVDRAGGRFAKSIYCMTKKGTLINLNLNGGSIGEWFEFTKKSKRRLPDEWVTITDVEERKKGATTYYVPVFKYNKSLNDEEAKLADEAYQIFEDFETEPSPRKKEADDYIKEDQFEPVKNGTGEVYSNDDDDLPF